MTQSYGLNPRQTIDYKFNSRDGTPLQNCNSQFIRSNEFKSEMHFVNSSGWDLLVLTADGLRLRSEATGHKEDGNCYFVVTYTLGGNVDLNVSDKIEDDPTLRQQLRTIEELVDNHRRLPGSYQVTRREAVVQFHYRIECTEIEHFKHGVWIPTVGVHLYQSTKRNGLCTHLGRSRFAEVLAFNDNFDNQEEVSQATGCGVVYYVSDVNNVDPIIVSNRHFSGVLFPEYAPEEIPGVHIYNVGQRNDVTNRRLTNIVIIPVTEFSTSGVYRNKRELEEALDGFVRRLKSPKDTDDYKEILENVRQTFPEFYKRYDVEQKAFDLNDFVNNFINGITAASKIKSAVGSKNG